MTPECSSCGLIVEFVRSCYVGQWRLFKDHPELLTTGRYVRAPEGTPHYPGWQNFVSSNWVADAETPPEPPELGEVTTGNRPWSNGAYRYPYPPAVVLGEAGCISDGETLPAVPTVRQTLDGFPAACWVRAGQMPPDPLPVNWFTPDGLGGYVDGDPIPLWGDISGLANNLQQTEGDPPPVKGNDGTWDYAEFTQHSRLDLKRSVELCDAFQLFMVVNLAGSPFATFLRADFQYPSLTVEPTRWIYNTPLNSAIFPIGGGASGLTVIALDRFGDRMTAIKNGGAAHTSPQHSSLHKFLSAFTAVGLYRRIIPPIFNVVLPVQVYEVMAFDTLLTVGQRNSWLAYLIGKYAP